MKSNFSMIVEYYLEDSADYMSQIESAASSGEAQNAAAPAHTLKSSSKLLGATRVADLSKQLEETCSAIGDGKSSDADITDLVSALREALDVARPQLEQVLSAECA